MPFAPFTEKANLEEGDPRVVIVLGAEKLDELYHGGLKSRVGPVGCDAFGVRVEREAFDQEGRHAVSRLHCSFRVLEVDAHDRLVAASENLVELLIKVVRVEIVPAEHYPRHRPVEVLHRVGEADGLVGLERHKADPRIAERGRLVVSEGGGHRRRSITRLERIFSLGEHLCGRQRICRTRQEKGCGDEIAHGFPSWRAAR